MPNARPTPSARERSIFVRMRETGHLRIGVKSLADFHASFNKAVFDADLCMVLELVRVLEVVPRILHCNRNELRAGLRCGALDLAVGSLQDEGHGDLETIMVHPVRGPMVAGEAVQCGQPYVWWIVADDMPWSARLRVFLAARAWRNRIDDAPSLPPAFPPGNR